MRIFNTICKKCGKHCDEDMDNCFVCGSKRIYYQSDISKKERDMLERAKELIAYKRGKEAIRRLRLRN